MTDNKRGPVAVNAPTNINPSLDNPDAPISTIDVTFDRDTGFELSQDDQTASGFKELTRAESGTFEGGEFYCVFEDFTRRIYGPYMTETAALSLLKEDGIKGSVRRMVLK